MREKLAFCWYVLKQELRGKGHMRFSHWVALRRFDRQVLPTYTWIEPKDNVKPPYTVSEPYRIRLHRDG